MTATISPELVSQADEQSFSPPVPESIEDTGLSPTLIEQLVLKILHFRGETSGRELSVSLGLKFSLIEGIMEFLKRGRMVEVKRSSGFGDVSAVFILSEAGRARAREYLDVNQYSGRAPVPIDRYAEGVRAQRSKDGWLTKDALREAYRHMVVSPEILAQIGPAVNSGKSFLICGQPGNGKTYLAEALTNIASSHIYVPYAIECQGVIIHLLDPLYHQCLDEAEDSQSSIAFELGYDGRWARCRRPFIVTGGELTLDMLDLSYNPSAKVYDAPFQVKANNGIYLIDDFGRQKVTPAELLNRWIFPMDRRIDYLSFYSGGKVAMPFEAFLIFSTNLHPDKLGDEAFLRRIQYKMFLRSPEEEEFIQIFEGFCASKKLHCSRALIDNFIEKHYHTTGKPFRRCQPGDFISHAIDLIRFERLPYELTDDVLDRAFKSCFIDSTQIEQ